MTPSHYWEQWDGLGFPSEKTDPIVYYTLDVVDIENPDNLDDLIVTLHQDGVAESKKEAREMLDTATVVHGQVLKSEGELQWYSGTEYGYGEEVLEATADATWIEMDSTDD